MELVTVEKAKRQNELEQFDRVEFARMSNCMVECKIFFHDIQVYQFQDLYMQDAMLRAIEYHKQLVSFPVPLNTRANIENKLFGRKVWYREVPAIVDNFDGFKGEVLLRVNPISLYSPKGFPLEPWSHGEVQNHNGTIWVDLLSPKIHWFYDEEE